MGVLDDPSTNSYIDGCFDGRKRLFKKIIQYNHVLRGGMWRRERDALRHFT
jgi:hypothetical protein